MKNDLKYKISPEWAFPMTHQVKNLPATQEAQETWVRSMGREDPPGGVHGNPLQYSCLGNSMDRGAWQRVTKSPWGHKEQDTTQGTEPTHVYSEQYAKK